MDGIRTSKGGRRQPLVVVDVTLTVLIGHHDVADDVFHDDGGGRRAGDGACRGGTRRRGPGANRGEGRQFGSISSAVMNKSINVCVCDRGNDSQIF